MVTDYTILEKASRWTQHGQAVAFVLNTWGSSPRKRGSMLLINNLGEFEGSVSGGCVENLIISEANEVITNGEPKRLFYSVSDETAWDTGLPCGGSIEVLILRLDLPKFYQQLMESVPKVLVANTTTGELGISGPESWTGSFQANDIVKNVANQLAKSGESSLQKIGITNYFFRPFVQPLKLIIIGAVHIAQFLATLAINVGFEVTIVDPRRSYATAERFPNISLITEWPNRALSYLSVDERTALVTLSHNKDIDDLALTIALKSHAFYIGALGSKKTHAKRLARLANTGIGQDTLARIKGPAGLKLDSSQPSEIAVSILAEIITIKNGVSN